MAFFELDDVFGYQDANDIKKLWASDTAPSDPAAGEIWLDTSAAPLQLKRYNGSGWDTIGELTANDILDALKTVDGSGSGLDADLLDGIESDSLLRSDTNDSFDGTLTSTKTSGAVVKFDNGDSCITVHDGYGNFNLKSGVDENHEIIVSDGGSHIELAESGKITIAVSAGTVGSTFTDDVYIQISQTGVTINGSTVWHAGNDGAGSGLDADKLDGQEGSFYRDASNLNAGSASRARLSELGDVDNPYICSDRKHIYKQLQNITFNEAYTDTPKVIAAAEESGRIVAITWRSTTSFQVQRTIADYPDFTFDAGYILWVAYGNRV